MTQETIVQMAFFSEFWQVLGFVLLLGLLLVVLWRMGRNAKAAAHEQALLHAALAQLTERVDGLAAQSAAASEQDALGSVAVTKQPAESAGMEGLGSGFRFAAEEPEDAMGEAKAEAVAAFSFGPEVAGPITSEDSCEDQIDYGAVQSRVSAWDAKPHESEEPALEEPALEEPALEEPALEEPALEEPALEEPALEEPALEEPFAADSEEERQPETAPSSAPSVAVASQAEAAAVLLPLPASPERPDVAMVRCGRCGRKIAYPKRLSGKPVRCPACQTGYTLP
jgi:hypothetical protein